MASKKILIIDDDQADRFLIQRFLKKSGLDVEFDECLDGVLALKYFEQVTTDSLPDLVLLDINMPRMNGIEFLAKYGDLVRSQPERATKFLVMLTSVSRSDEEICLEYEFVVGQVAKSHEQLQMLIDEVQRVLEA